MPSNNTVSTSIYWSPLTDGVGGATTNWFFKDTNGSQQDFNPQNWIESQAEVVPLPATVVLLGSGLLGLAGWGRRKFRKN